MLRFAGGEISEEEGINDLAPSSTSVERRCVAEAVRTSSSECS